MWGENAGWPLVPMPGPARSKALPPARRIEPRRATRPKNGNFKNGEWTAEAIEERRWLRSLVRAFAQKDVGS